MDSHTKATWVQEKLDSTSWDKIGYWEQAGKGRAFISTEPGTSITTLQGILAFFAVIALFSKSTISLVVLICIIIGMQYLKHFMRRKYLEKKYEELSAIDK